MNRGINGGICHIQHEQRIRGIITFSRWGTSVWGHVVWAMDPRSSDPAGACSSFLIMNQTFTLAYGKRKNSLYVTASTNHTVKFKLQNINIRKRGGSCWTKVHAVILLVCFKGIPKWTIRLFLLWWKNHVNMV